MTQIPVDDRWCGDVLQEQHRQTQERTWRRRGGVYHHQGLQLLTVYHNNLVFIFFQTTTMNKKTPRYNVPSTVTGNTTKPIPVPVIQEVKAPDIMGMKQLAQEILELACCLRNQEELLNKTLFMPDDKSDSNFPIGDGIEGILLAAREIMLMTKWRFSKDLEKLDNEIQ